MLNARRRRLRKTPEFRQGFIEGHDAGYNKAAAHYMHQNRLLLQALEAHGIVLDGQENEESETRE